MVDRKEILENVTEMAGQLKDLNDVMDEAAPILLPEVARFLNQCKPVADLISDYIMGPKFKAAVRYNTASQVALKLLESGKDPSTVAVEADRIVRELESLANK